MKKPDREPTDTPSLGVRRLMTLIEELLATHGYVAKVAWKRNTQGEDVIGIVGPKLKL